jgi:hypothetical protein
MTSRVLVIFLTGLKSDNEKKYHLIEYSLSAANWLGVLPVCLAKALRKVDIEAKPL